MESSVIRRFLTPVLALMFVAGAAAQQAPASAQMSADKPVERIDTAMIDKIKAEGMDHSKLMWIEHYLTDVYGPRPIGSPNHVAAANWAVKTMTSWGMQNAHLEPFTWRGIGWMPGRATGFITSPVKANIKFETLPWAPSTKGTVSGQVLHLLPPVAPTEAELSAYLAEMAPKVKGGIVMTGAIPDAPVIINPPAKRMTDEQAKQRYQPDPNAPAAAGRGNRGGGGGGRGNQPQTPLAEGHLSAQQVNARLTALVRDNPPALRIVASGNPGRIPGTIVAQNGAGQQYDEENQVSPGVILRNDDFGRIARIIADGTGIVRGASIFGPPAAAAALAQILKPFESWGVFGALPSSARVEGGSDNGAFAVAGLPGIGTGQDNIEYNTATWHSNIDNYERIVPDDVMKNAVITASVMWHLANRDELLPRFSAADMPAIPAGRGAGAGRGGNAPAGPAPADPHVFAAKKDAVLNVAAKSLLPPVAAANAPARTVSLATKPAHGTLVLKADGSFTYTPAKGFAGTDTFTYILTTGGVATLPGTVTVVVR
jgi:hypothetical protein